MLFYFIYCPNLTSTPPCPASITILNSGLGIEEGLTVKQTTRIEEMIIIHKRAQHKKLFLITMNLIP